MIPTLSVLMTSYNREQFIAEAIDSVLSSSFSDFELIIVDDCSTDSTFNIIRQYAAKDRRIRIFQNDNNLGDYPNRNKAAGYATGEYIMFVDSDDKILPFGFEVCVAQMEKYPEVGIGMQFKEIESEPFLLNSTQVIRQHFFGKPCLMIGPGGTIMRRKYFNKIHGYPIQYGPACDMYFNLKAASASPVLMLPFYFNFYRIHEGQEINNKFSYLYNNYNYLRDALNELSLNLSEREKRWIMNKNRRRFLNNLFNYIIGSRDIYKSIDAYRKAEFGIRDVWMALYHENINPTVNEVLN